MEQGRLRTQIVDNCDDLLDKADSVRMVPYVHFAKKAVDGLRAGHRELAQAMIMNTFDTVLQHSFHKKTRLDLTNTSKPLDTDELTLRVYFARCAIWSLHGHYYPDKGDPIPRLLNRHASVHGVSRRQYSRLNAVLALAHLTALIWYLDTHYSGARSFD